MKIIGGKFKGRNFYMPASIRPTQNITRKAVFDLLGHDLTDMAFLDLFAGSGGVGLEAISWGAKQVTFVEKDLKCLKIIEENLQLLGLKEPVALGRYTSRAFRVPQMPATHSEAEPYEVVGMDVFVAVKLFAKQERKYDIVFFDPPYERGLAKKILKTLVGYDILHRNCLVIVEFSKREPLPDLEGRFSIVKQRKYGKSYLAVYEGH